ncbi:MAG: acyltransferase [Bacteroidales bacterium]|nr:acyltransferase [Bacteroidales bacterium]
MMDYFVHESSYVDEGVLIGADTKIWHFCHIQHGAVIGEGCSLGQNVNIGPGVVLGKGVRIQNNVSVYEGVELEDDVFCGPSCVFTNVLMPRAEFPVNGEYQKTLVKKGASLGANSTIVCGHTIGSYALVAAGAVVTQDVPDYALMAGIPARQIGWVCQCGKRLPNPVSVQDECQAKGCACGREYEMIDGKMTLIKNDTAQ